MFWGNEKSQFEKIGFFKKWRWFETIEEPRKKTPELKFINGGGEGGEGGGV